MGFAISLECPYCGNSGEHKVTSTPANRTWNLSGNTGTVLTGVSGRLRVRQCSSCDNEFQTLELALASESFSEITANAEAGAHLKELIAASWDGRPDLQNQLSYFFISCALPEAPVDKIRSRMEHIIPVAKSIFVSLQPKYAIYLINNASKLIPHDMIMETKISRMIKHPSRSRSLRATIEQ